MTAAATSDGDDSGGGGGGEILAQSHQRKQKGRPAIARRPFVILSDYEFGLARWAGAVAHVVVDFDLAGRDV